MHEVSLCLPPSLSLSFSGSLPPSLSLTGSICFYVQQIRSRDECGLSTGKSLLHARLTGGDDERARDALFASLETQRRSGRLDDGSEVLYVDTVGFVEQMPHGLVRVTAV